VRLTLSEIAALVAGKLCGDGELRCTGASPPAEATETEITMLDDPQHASRVAESAAAALVTTETIASLRQAQIIVADPHAAFAKIVAHFRPPVTADHSDYDTLGAPVIDSSARIDLRALVGGGASIGANTHLMPGAIVMMGLAWAPGALTPTIVGLLADKTPLGITGALQTLLIIPGSVASVQWANRRG